MLKLEKMKKISLILSFLFLTTCAHASFDVKKLYVVDLVNQVCAEYDIVDQVNFKVRLSRELELLRGGPCDRLTGFSRNDIKKVQNYIRDSIRECSK